MAHFLLYSAALVVLLSILTIAATMLSSSITIAEDLAVMELDVPSAEIAETQDRSPTNPVGVF